MLMNRVATIAALMVVGLLLLSISTWIMAFNPSSSEVAAWSWLWTLQRLPILIGLVMIVAGFRMLGTTKVPAPVMTDDDPAP